MWRSHYGFLWSTYAEWLLVIGENGVQALQPIGPPSRLEVARMLLQWMRKEKGVAAPRIDRADARFVSELAGDPGFEAKPARDHFDYVYTTRDLIDGGQELQGQEEPP